MPVATKHRKHIPEHWKCVAQMLTKKAGQDKKYKSNYKLHNNTNLLWNITKHLWISQITTNASQSTTWNIFPCTKIPPHWLAWGEAVLHKIFSSWIQHTIFWETQSDLRFCQNEVSKRSEINEKDWKSRRKLIQNAQNLLNNTFWWKTRPRLGPSISGTRCDRDKLILSVERGSIGMC